MMGVLNIVRLAIVSYPRGTEINTTDCKSALTYERKWNTFHSDKINFTTLVQWRRVQLVPENIESMLSKVNVQYNVHAYSWQTTKTPVITTEDCVRIHTILHTDYSPGITITRDNRHAGLWQGNEIKLILII